MDKRTNKGPQDKRSKLHRSEIITLRLEPELRFLLNLATRTKRQTISSFMEEAAKTAVQTVQLRRNGVMVSEVAPLLWHPLEPDRLVKLALRYPELLLYEEQVMWVFIVECDALWSLEASQRRTMGPEAETACNFPLLRAHWEAFKQAARDMDPTCLPEALSPRHGLPAPAGSNGMAPSRHAASPS